MIIIIKFDSTFEHYTARVTVDNISGHEEELRVGWSFQPRPGARLEC